MTTPGGNGNDKEDDQNPSSSTTTPPAGANQLLGLFAPPSSSSSDVSSGLGPGSGSGAPPVPSSSNTAQLTGLFAPPPAPPHTSTSSATTSSSLRPPRPPSHMTTSKSKAGTTKKVSSSSSHNRDDTPVAGNISTKKGDADQQYGFSRADRDTTVVASNQGSSAAAAAAAAAAAEAAAAVSNLEGEEQHQTTKRGQHGPTSSIRTVPSHPTPPLPPSSTSSVRASTTTYHYNNQDNHSRTHSQHLINLFAPPSTAGAGAPGAASSSATPANTTGISGNDAYSSFVLLPSTSSGGGSDGEIGASSGGGGGNDHNEISNRSDDYLLGTGHEPSEPTMRRDNNNKNRNEWDKAKAEYQGLKSNDGKPTYQSPLSTLYSNEYPTSSSLSASTKSFVPIKDSSSSFMSNHRYNEYQTYNASSGSDGRRGTIKSLSARFSSTIKTMTTWCKSSYHAIIQPTTMAGAFMFCLYHVVFCLANASGILRPHKATDAPILGLMAQVSTIGIVFAAPFYILRFGSDIPALYPSIDLFMAPFWAQAAIVIDQSLYDQYQEKAILQQLQQQQQQDDAGTAPTLSPSTSYPDEVFLASFAVLTMIGMILAGALLVLGATFKLANLGTFLPYSVLCGFFSAVGVLLWALAFSVDNHGKTWQSVFLSGTTSYEDMWIAIIHHIPSLAMGIIMNRLGPKNPFFVILLILVTLVLFYIIMFITGTSLEEAQERQWFWSSHELVYEPSTTMTTTTVASSGSNSTGIEGFFTNFSVLPPMPLANTFCVLFPTYTNWIAVYKGLGHMMAMAFLYLLRSSIHASALKKNIGNLVRRIPKETNTVGTHDDTNDDSGGYDAGKNKKSDDDVVAATTPTSANDTSYDDGDDMLIRNPSTASSTAAAASNIHHHRYASSRAYEVASAIVGSVSQGVRVVNMSLADDGDVAAVAAAATVSSPLLSVVPSARPSFFRSRLSSEDVDMEKMALLASSSTKNVTNYNSSNNINVRNKSHTYSTRQRMTTGKGDDNDEQPIIEYIEIRPKPIRKTLEEIFLEYGYALFVNAFCGGFGNCPTVATSKTMYAIGAEGMAPQVCSVILLLIFYFTNFELVQYIPKAAFSSLLVLGAVDTLVVWFFGAYSKTLEISEWLVVPFIVAFSLYVGFLNAVFMGIAISMFVFVGTFFRVGVVKFHATGSQIRSRIERSMAQSVWLDDKGDWIQVLVLQNYLFFGNASSILHYIATMFEDIETDDDDVVEEENNDKNNNDEEKEDSAWPPKPKVLILDMSLITGMDTSTVDIFAEIKAMCHNNHCKLYLCGLSTRMKRGLALANVKLETKKPRDERIVRFFSDLDTSLGKAEDYLLKTIVGSTIDNPLLDQYDTTSVSSSPSTAGNGFHHALKQIEELHGLSIQHQQGQQQPSLSFVEDLLPLQSHVLPIELQPGQCLFACDGGIVGDEQRGLFFIESGLLRFERDSSTYQHSLTALSRTRSGHTFNRNSINNSNNNNGNSRSVLYNVNNNNNTLKGQHARMGSHLLLAQPKSGRQSNNMNQQQQQQQQRNDSNNPLSISYQQRHQQNFRVARIGPGWVVGTLENASGVRPLGVTLAVTHCRLHLLTFETLESLENEHPILVLKLYKMLSHLMARREEITVEHLSTLHNILSSPAHSKPLFHRVTSNNALKSLSRK